MPHRQSLPHRKGNPAPMVEIVRTNNLVLMGFLQSLLENANIPVLVADLHISALEGMIGAFPRRLLVPGDHAAQARRLITEAGLDAELRHG
jgi:Putative prokaryotic signal transducing protein